MAQTAEGERFAHGRRPDGKVLITGGTDPDAWSKFMSSGVPIPPAAELYDPTTETFAAIDGMKVHFTGTAAKSVRLPNGKVFIVYGNLLVDSSFPCPYTISGESYDPALGTFTYTSPMLNPRSQYFSATVLQDGKVLVAGGLVNGLSATAELYD